MIGFLVELDGAAGGERSAEASLSSNACSTFRSGRPSISRMRPELVLLALFWHGQQALLMAYSGMACTRSRSVTPGCICP